MSQFDRERTLEVLQQLVAELDGDWVLLGGSLATVWFDGARTTEDIDIVSATPSDERRYQLFDFATRLGLSVEALNSAADYFLYRVPGYAEQLEPLLVGSKSRILRPTPTLFLLLKIERMSEADLEDCLRLIEHVSATGMLLDRARIFARLDAVVESSKNAAERRAVLRARL